MNQRLRSSARLPPAGIDGLDPRWSRLVVDRNGSEWHVLDRGPSDAELTLLCVHGNPSWSFLWRKLVAGAPDRMRVVAVDQLDMGYSERTGISRCLTTRIDDLGALTDTLGLTGRVVTVAHDWGGPISLGWALHHRPQLAGVVLLNTAVHQPVGSPAPSIIRLVRSRAVLRLATVGTAAFLRGAIKMSNPPLAAEVRAGLLAPYRTADRREAIADFVADIPLDPSHQSAAALDEIADGLHLLGDVPALLLWGPRDPVFSDLYLHDIERRLPHADVHRFVGASHFVSEDVDVVGPILDWLDSNGRASGCDAVVPCDRGRLWDGLDADLADRVERTAGGMSAAGIRSGDRVALMIPPSDDLNVALYACWRVGAEAVLIDAGLGPKGMSRAMKSAAPDHLIGIERALGAARALRWPGRRWSVEPLSAARRRAFGVRGDLRSMELYRGVAPDAPKAAQPAAVVFTSGATGPSKGVRYRHHQLEAQRDALAELYGITDNDRLVAAFAPFALYGPALGIASVVPDMDVAAPGSLTASALGDAVVQQRATLVFASPAALVNVLRTADDLTADHRHAFAHVRLLLSAGAPVSQSLLRAGAALFPNAEAHTPYGMTEVLPVASSSLIGIELAGRGNGVCVGLPLPSVDVVIDPLDHDGTTTGSLSSAAEITGEVLVKAPHARDGYDRLWHTEYRASQPPGWHRTGDVGHLDTSGRLWIEGRIGHVITTSKGPVTPVGLERSVESLSEVALAAVVGVGPVGVQQVVVVVQLERGESKNARLADLALVDRVRRMSEVEVAAVFVVASLPVDRRHNSKIDRTRVAQWAADALAGGRIGTL